MADAISVTVAMSTRRRLPVATLGEPALRRCQRGAGVTADVVRQRTKAREQRRHPRQRVGFVVDGELHVVDLADETTVAVDELAVEQLECRPDLATYVRRSDGHEPALVAIMSGIVARATTVSTTM